MAKTFVFNAIKGIRLVDKSGKVKDEAVKSKLGDQNLFRFKNGIVWAKPFKLTIPSLPQGVKSLSVKRTSTKRSLATNGELSDGDDIYYNDTLTVETKPSIGYYPPTLNATAITVEDNHTVSVQAGDTYDWAVIIPPLQEGFSSFSVKNYVTDEKVFATDQEQILEMGRDDHYGRGSVPYYDYYTSGNREYRVYVVYPDGFAHRAGVSAGDGIGGGIGLNEKYNIVKCYLMPPNATMGTIVGYPQTRDYVDTIYFNTALSKEKVKQIVERVIGLDTYEYEHLFYSGKELPMTITIYFDGNGEFEIRGRISLNGSTINEYTYFDTKNGWKTGFGGSIQVQADPQDYIPAEESINGEFPEFVGMYNPSLTELMSATNTFDDFSQVTWD